jgi:hypothetical protein
MLHILVLKYKTNTFESISNQKTLNFLNQLKYKSMSSIFNYIVSIEFIILQIKSKNKESKKQNTAFFDIIV